MQQRSASIAIPTRISCVTRSNPFTAPILIITNAQLYYVAAADVGIIASLPEMTIFRFLLVQRSNCTAKVRPSTPFVAIFHRGVPLVIKGRDNYPPTTQITSPARVRLPDDRDVPSMPDGEREIGSVDFVCPSGIERVDAFQTFPERRNT